MAEPDVETLREELEHFHAEKERVRAIVGKIGGAASTKRDKTINILFILAIITLFVFDLLRHVCRIDLGRLPPVFPLQMGILLVSIKIVWMLHRQTKIEHFQFWVLNSIEFRLNDLARRFAHLGKDSRPAAKETQQAKT